MAQPSIRSSEVVPGNYNSYRNVRSDEKDVFLSISPQIWKSRSRGTENRGRLWIGLGQSEDSRFKGLIHMDILWASWQAETWLSWTALEVPVQHTNSKWCPSLAWMVPDCIDSLSFPSFLLSTWLTKRVCCAVPQPWCTVQAATDHCQACLS